MVVISSAELRSNMKNETFVLTAQQNPVEYDLSRAITVDEVIAKVREGLTEMFERKCIVST